MGRDYPPRTDGSTRFLTFWRSTNQRGEFPLMNPLRRHDSLTQILHWSIALLVVTAFVIAEVREDLPRGDMRTLLLGWHTLFGVTVFALTLVRLAWRPFATVPQPLGQTWIDRGARLAHIALYGLLVAVPVLGIVLMWARGRGIDVFWLFTLPSPWAADRALARTSRSRPQHRRRCHAAAGGPACRRRHCPPVRAEGRHARSDAAVPLAGSSAGGLTSDAGPAPRLQKSALERIREVPTLVVGQKTSER